MDSRNELEETFLRFGELLEEMSNVDGIVDDKKLGIAMQMEEATLGIPVQLDILVSDDGQVEIGGTPPLHYTETSFDPVFHQLKITLKANSVDGEK